MNDLISIFKKDLYDLIYDLENKGIISNFKKSNVSIDYSSKSKQGDLSTNIFILLSKQKLIKEFDLRKYTINFFNNLIYIDKVDVAKIGFLNLIVNKDYIIDKFKETYNNIESKIQKKLNTQKINIEFVSANPTGPIHIAHMRGAVLGDVLSSILNSVGHQVTREYYVNDAGSQIITLGNSLYKRYQELHGLEINLLDGEYPGGYLIDIAVKIKELDGDKWLLDENVVKRKSYFQKFSVHYLLENIKNDLSSININFDKFSFESEIVERNYIEDVFQILKEKDLIYRGVLDKPLGDDHEWEPRKQLLFRSTKFSDDSDRAFQKFNGEWTYFANDSAYHYEKYKRGFDKLINIWGADHIGDISRMKSIVSATSNKEDYLEIFICQIVRLIKNGKILKMSKREGNFITLNEIKDHVGKDALRYFMVSSKSEGPMDFDMNKVIEKNKDNPVFYCQYAYARASSVIRKAKKFEKISTKINHLDLFDKQKLSDYEWEIIFKLLSWPYLLHQAADSMQPHRITNFLEDLCSSFHSFWNKGKDNTSLRFIDENDIPKTITKLIWIKYFQSTLKDIFEIIGIESPESM